MGLISRRTKQYCWLSVGSVLFVTHRLLSRVFLTWTITMSVAVVDFLVDRASERFYADDATSSWD